MRSVLPVEAPLAVVRAIIGGRVRSAHRALSERDLAAELAVGLRTRSESVRAVSWDDDGPRRFLHRVFVVLAAVAVAGHYAPAWFGL